MLGRPQDLSRKFYQGTLRSIVTCEGIGVHTGENVFLRLLPEKPDSGIVFIRSDKGGVEIKAGLENVVDTRFCTTLGSQSGLTVSTVEHLMAALFAMGVDNLRVEVSGPELPIFDGSAAPFIKLIQQAGVAVQKASRRRLKVLKALRVGGGEDRWLQISPSALFQVSVDVPLGPCSRQTYTYSSKEDFHLSIASARTFSLLEDVEKMQKAGLIKGGSLENAVVLDGNRVMNPEGLRFPEECARHKILDIIGDFALSGFPLLGHIQGRRPGHALNYKLLKAFLQDQDAWCFEEEKGPPPKRTPPLSKTEESPFLSAPLAHQPVAVFAASAYNG